MVESEEMIPDKASSIDDDQFDIILEKEEKKRKKEEKKRKTKTKALIDDDSGHQGKKGKKHKNKNKKKKHKERDSVDTEVEMDVREHCEDVESTSETAQATNDNQEVKQKQEEQREGQEQEKKKEKEGKQQTDKPSKKRKRKGSKVSKRREERQALMDKVPKVDQHGIGYTKIQLRRMMKRVKRGLPPLETPEEEQERLHRDAELRKEEEAELAGMLFNRENGKRDNNQSSLMNDDDNDNNDDGSNYESSKEIEREEWREENQTRINGDDNTEGRVDLGKDGPDQPAQPVESVENSQQPPKKVKRREKPVPDDYVCQACQNGHSPRHWIYDCPQKVTVRGTNQVSKKGRGIHNPDARKVFVSGLPFHTKRKDLELLFKACGKMVHCKVLTFPDTGRCKGQAFLTFDSEDAAKKAMIMNGTSISNEASENDNRLSTTAKRKELKLKVSKVLNRQATKKGSRS